MDFAPRLVFLWWSVSVPEIISRHYQHESAHAERGEKRLDGRESGGPRTAAGGRRAVCSRHDRVWKHKRLIMASTVTEKPARKTRRGERMIHCGTDNGAEFTIYAVEAPKCGY